MKCNIAVLSLLILMFALSFASSSTLSEYKPQKVDQEFNFTQTCEDATYITLSNIQTPNSTEFINVNMTYVGGGSFYYNYTPNQIGDYDFAGISDGCLKTYAVYVPVTANGKTYDTGDALILIFVSTFLIFMMFVFHKTATVVNYERWYERIKEKYITRNFVKWSLSAIAYNIMINSFIVYFLLGLPIVLILMDLVFIFNITSIMLYMQSIVYVYYTMIMVLAIVFLSFLQEWFMQFIKDIEDIDWGLKDER